MDVHVAAPGSEPSSKIGFASQVVPIRLANITDEHPIAKELHALLKLPYFFQPRRECLPRHIVHSLLERTPLLIRQEKNGFVCIGNIRLYRLANAILDPNDLIPTIEHSGKLNREWRDRLRQGLLVETFLLPAVFHRRPSELRALGAAWKRAADEGMMDFWSGGSFAALYEGAPVSSMKTGVPHLG